MHRLKTASPGQPCRVRQHSQQVVSLQILIVRQDLVVRHAGTQQFQQRLNGVSQSPHTRLAVAHGRVNRDSSQ